MPCSMYMPEALLFNEPVTLSLKQISASNYSTPLGAKTAATASGTETGKFWSASRDLPSVL